MPNIFGGYQNYWGGGMYWEGSMAVSLTGFVLALYGLAVSRDRQKFLFALSGLFFTLIAIGKRGPLFIPFCKYFPLFNTFRGVGKLNILITVSLVVLAALGMDEIMKSSHTMASLAKGSLGGAAFTSLLALIGWGSLRWGGGRLFGKFLGFAPLVLHNLLICSTLFLSVAFFSWQGLKKPWLRYGLVVLAFLELLSFAHSNMPFFEAQTLKDRVGVIPQTYAKDPGGLSNIGALLLRDRFECL